jgi:hemolysin activation/secretion protein
MKTCLISLLLGAVLYAAPADRDNTVVVPSLKGLTFLGSAQDVKKTGVDSQGVSLVGVPLLNSDDFKEEVVAYLGEPVTFKDLNQITSKVSAFYKHANHPLVDVVVPEQDVTSGVIQVVVNEFRVGEVRVEGNRWFSDNIVSAPVSLRHGDTIDTQKLLNEMNAANSNPFRRVDLVYQPGQPGYTDLVLNTQDRFPVSVYTGFDNSGTPATGRSRWNMGATWGNALWHDEQLSYQFSASDNFFSGNGVGGAAFISNSLNWTIPVRARDSISIFGNYQKAVPNVGTDFGFVGKSGQASIRYSLALPRFSRFNETVQLGYDFKTTNNNLAFGGTQVSRTNAEIDQFPLTYAANLTDRLGSYAFTTSLVFSPGSLSPNNKTNDFQPGTFQSGVFGAQARYTYWRSDFTRLTKLPYKGVYAFRLLGQTSSTNLLYTEKLTGGGPDILRGYDPNSVYGDSGIVMTNELRTPALKPFAEYGLGQVQLCVFWDYGHLQAVHNFPGQLNSVAASSVGTGLRYDLRSNLTSSVTYGRALIQLPNTNAAARNDLVNLNLTLAY